MGWLRRGVHDGIRLHLIDKRQHSFAVADIELVMNKTWQVPLKPLLVPAGITLWPKEGGTLIIVHTMNFPAQLGKVYAYFGADEAGRSCNE